VLENAAVSGVFEISHSVACDDMGAMEDTSSNDTTDMGMMTFSTDMLMINV
jgi:hypothetical protein